MRLLNSLSSALVAISLSSAIAAPADEVPTCIIPLIIFESIGDPFTLSAVANAIPTSNSDNAFPVRTLPRSPTRRVLSEPIISNAKIASTQFRLKNNKLIVEGFRAKLLPFIEIFPPVLREFVWGGDVFSSPINFTAGFACDNRGKQFLRLFTDEGTFAVKNYTEGQRVFIKPNGFKGEVVDIALKINQETT